ncbi:transcriptional regulator with XRE-family HTH domain [Rhodococcus sp. LBL1]|nr:transcriptional regulator with XRE-family HTH domain [Rhodococcus sp. LBL1]MDH6685007.1 transcriptional regulator with XRE-family HTH domain [Rhodococcus sp. LBL2]
MQNIEGGSTRGSESAKQWASEQAARFGKAVQDHRKAMGLSAVQLADRTEKLGYPITRGTIAKIEGNHRAGKLDLAELVVLAAALSVPPVLLLYPVATTERDIEFLPELRCSDVSATQWFAGEKSIATDDPEASGRTNELMDALQRARRLADLRADLGVAERAEWLMRHGKRITEGGRDREITGADVETAEKHVAELRQQIAALESAPWPAGWTDA